MSLVIRLTKGTLREAFENHAKKLNIAPNKLIIVIGLAENHEPVYYLMQNGNYQQKTALGYYELTLMKGDLFNTCEMAKQNFAKFIGRIAEQKKLDPLKTEVMVVTPEEKADNVKKIGLMLYHNKQLVCPITFDYFFGEEEMPQ